MDRQWVPDPAECRIRLNTVQGVYVRRLADTCGMSQATIVALALNFAAHHEEEWAPIPRMLAWGEPDQKR